MTVTCELWFKCDECGEIVAQTLYPASIIDVQDYWPEDWWEDDEDGSLYCDVCTDIVLKNKKEDMDFSEHYNTFHELKGKEAI